MDDDDRDPHERSYNSKFQISQTHLKIGKLGKHHEKILSNYVSQNLTLSKHFSNCSGLIIASNNCCCGYNVALQ